MWDRTLSWWTPSQLPLTPSVPQVTLGFAPTLLGILTRFSGLVGNSNKLWQSHMFSPSEQCWMSCCLLVLSMHKDSGNDYHCYWLIPPMLVILSLLHVGALGVTISKDDYKFKRSYLLTIKSMSSSWKQCGCYFFSINWLDEATKPWVSIINDETLFFTVMTELQFSLQSPLHWLTSFKPFWIPSKIYPFLYLKINMFLPLPYGPIVTSLLS